MVDPGVRAAWKARSRAGASTYGKDEVIDPEAQNPEVAIAQSYADHPDHEPPQLSVRAGHHLPAGRSVSKAQTAPAVVDGDRVGEDRAAGVGRNGLGHFRGGEIRPSPGSEGSGLRWRPPRPRARSPEWWWWATRCSRPTGTYRLSGNKDFGLNAVSWTAKEESRISIRPKQRQGNHLFLSAEQKRTMTLFAFDLLPFGLLFAGLVVWHDAEIPVDAMKQTTKTLLGLVVLLCWLAHRRRCALDGQGRAKKAEAKEKSEKLFDFDKSQVKELRLSKDGQLVARLEKGDLEGWKLAEPVQRTATTPPFDSLLLQTRDELPILRQAQLLDLGLVEVEQLLALLLRLRPSSARPLPVQSAAPPMAPANSGGRRARAASWWSASWRLPGFPRLPDDETGEEQPKGSRSNAKSVMVRFCSAERNR